MRCAAMIRGPRWVIEVAGEDAAEVERVALGLMARAGEGPLDSEERPNLKEDGPMDLATATAVIATATSAVSLFDKVADQVVRFIGKGSEPPGPAKEHRVQVEGGPEGLSVKLRGQTIQVIQGEDLKSLPADIFGHIKTMEESVGRYYSVWKQVYPHRDDGDLVTNAKLNNQLRDLALKMKDDLTGIVDFLQTIGVRLDDHYVVYRDVIRRYTGDA
jgi:hypothetical protein